MAAAPEKYWPDVVGPRIWGSFDETDVTPITPDTISQWLNEPIPPALRAKYAGMFGPIAGESRMRAIHMISRALWIVYAGNPCPRSISVWATGGICWRVIGGDWGAQSETEDEGEAIAWPLDDLAAHAVGLLAMNIRFKWPAPWRAVTAWCASDDLRAAPDIFREVYGRHMCGPLGAAGFDEIFREVLEVNGARIAGSREIFAHAGPDPEELTSDDCCRTSRCVLNWWLKLGPDMRIHRYDLGTDTGE